MSVLIFAQQVDYQYLLLPAQFPPSPTAAFSSAIRFNSSDAGSSFGSCGTSLPRTARLRMNRRRRGMASGASAIQVEVGEQVFGVHLRGLLNDRYIFHP